MLPPMLPPHISPPISPRGAAIALPAGWARAVLELTKVCGCGGVIHGRQHRQEQLLLGEEQPIVRPWGDGAGTPIPYNATTIARLSTYRPVVPWVPGIVPIPPQFGADTPRTDTCIWSCISMYLGGIPPSRGVLCDPCMIHVSPHLHARCRGEVKIHTKYIHDTSRKKTIHAPMHARRNT